MKWGAPLGIFGGIALSAAGVGWALVDGWQPLYIVGLLGVGLIVSLFVKKFNFNFIFGGR